MVASKGFALAGTAVSGFSSALTGIFVGPENYVDEVSNNRAPLTKYREQGEELSAVSITRTVSGKPETQTLSTTPRIDNNLDKHYFGSWRVLSEGGLENLYLVDVDGKFQKVERSGHSNDVKSLWNGRRLTDGEWFWFGPRKFPFDAQQASKGNLEPSWKILIKLAKQQNAGELRQLDAFLNEKGDDELCDILDVFWSCEGYKRELSNDGKSIKGDLTFNLANIESSLKNVNVDGDSINPSDWGHIARLLSRTLTFKKIRAFQATAGRKGAEWVKKSISQSKGDEFENPVDYLSSYFGNEKFGFDCKEISGDSESGWRRRFFEECEIQKDNRHRAKGVEVSHVLKSTYNTKGTYWIPKVNKGSAWTDQLRMEDPLRRRFEEGQKIGILGSGVVDEGCQKHQTSLFWGYIPSAASELCKHINEQFFGRRVDQKRYCRYEIPNARGYLRAHRYSIITFTTWVKGNAFWAKCHANGY